MSNAAVTTLETRLENVTGRCARAKIEKDRCGETYGKASDYYRQLVQEELDLQDALNELADLQNEGRIRS